MKEVPMEVTVSYNGVDSLKFYRNGEFFKELVVKRPLVILDSAKTMISPTYMDGTTPRKYEGSMEYLKVYNRALSNEEVKNNYSKSSVITDSLELYYDFSEIKYQSNDGYYPTLKDDYIMTVADEQILTQLPDDTIREYIAEANNGGIVNYKKLVDDKIENIYNIYSSSINTINLEFDDSYNDLSFSYKYGDYQSDSIKAKNRVYSLTYDYINDLEITISSANDSRTYKYKADELSKKIKVLDNNYYHISEGYLYKNNKKLINNAVHIYNDLVLLKNGKLYDLNSNKEINSILSKGVLPNAVALYEFNLDDSFIRTFYSFSEVHSEDGYAIRDGQIMSRDNTMFVFDYNKNSKSDMNVFDVYNTSIYQISLRNSSLVSLMEKVNYPNFFINSNIIEVSFDVDSKKPILLIRYDNGYIYAFDYYTGEELFEYGEKTKTTLFKFIADSLSDDTTISISNDSYDESRELKDSLIEVKDDKVKEKLNINIGNSTDNNKDNNKVENEDSEKDKNTSKGTNINSKYIQVYDYDTDTYEVYNTNDLLNPVNKEVVSEKIKIKSDAFLYNYFYDNKVNRLLDGSKLLIYGVIIVLVVINLIFFIRYMSTKEVKNRG